MIGRQCSYRGWARLLFLLSAAIPLAGARAQAPGANPLQNVPAVPVGQPQETETKWDKAAATFTPDALQGPPTPAVMYAVVGRDDRQLAQYLAAYRAHMAATWNTRYALMSALKMVNRADKNADVDAVRYYEVVARQLWRELSTGDESFDLAASAILRKSQVRRYREWKAAWQHGAQVQQRLDARAGSGEPRDSG
jgi:hypothetical protein